MHLAAFEPLPTDPLHLVLLMTDIENILGEYQRALPTAAPPPGRAYSSVTNITSIIGSYIPAIRMRSGWRQVGAGEATSTEVVPHGVQKACGVPCQQLGLVVVIGKIVGVRVSSGSLGI
jgi:hypothetical protein